MVALLQKESLNQNDIFLLKLLENHGEKKLLILLKNIIPIDLKLNF